jgi:hypothetical protein
MTTMLCVLPEKEEYKQGKKKQSGCSVPKDSVLNTGVQFV